MNLFKTSELFLAVVVSALALAAIVAITTGTYRSAGGPIGAERIQQRAALKAAPGAQTVHPSNWNGPAGGSLGIERVAGVQKVKTYATGQTETPVLCRRGGASLRIGI